jgi:choline dehydrogenase-like flavoprotein
MGIAAYHPLGTCHMSGFRGRSVCDPNGETYEVRNLFVADGSLIPPSLGVNPQVTIAAVATRVGHYISDRLGHLSQR